MGYWSGAFGAMRLKVLVVEGDPTLARLTAAAVAALLVNAEVEIASTLDAAEARLQQARFGALVASASLASDPFSVVQRLRPMMAGPFLISGVETMSLAVEGIRRGADDVLLRSVAPYVVADRLMARLKEASPRKTVAETATRPALTWPTFTLSGQPAE